MKTKVEHQLAALRKRRQQLDLREQEILKVVRKRTLVHIATLAFEYGLDAAEVAAAINIRPTPKTIRQEGAAKKGQTSKTKRPLPPHHKVLPKYSNPDNPEETWTGRGKSPKWVSSLRECGKLATALIIKVDP